MSPSRRIQSGEDMVRGLSCGRFHRSTSRTGHGDFKRLARVANAGDGIDHRDVQDGQVSGRSGGGVFDAWIA